MLRLISTILPLYLIIRLVLPLHCRLWCRILLSLLIVLCAVKYPLFDFFYGTFTPPLPRWAMMLTGISHGAVVILTVFCLMRDLFLLLWWAARKLSPRLPRYDLSTGRWTLALSLLSLLLASGAVWQGLSTPILHRIDIELSRLPRCMDGLRLIHLTDLHISPTFGRDWVRYVVDKTNSLDPDIILITGDMADGLPSQMEADLAPLRALKAAYGVFSCPGNHEYYWDYPAWMQKSRELGLTPLENTHVVLDIEGVPLVLAGVTDQAAGRFDLPLPDVRQALDGAPDDAIRIMLAHRPQLLPKSAAAGVDLQLSGHTHGGQMPGLDLLVAWSNDGFLRGVYQLGECLLHLSPGCALWPGFPLRLFVPAEITEITLKSSKEAYRP